MCGLFGGLSTVLSASEVNAVKTLGLLASLRGMDSTGIIVGKNRSHAKGPTLALLKHTCPSQEFLWDAGVETAMMNSFLIVGHARSATVGELSAANAQPFHSKHIWGCHNGTIRDLEPRNKADKRSDSAVLFDLVAEEGLENTLEKVGYGAYALVWVNEQTKCINFLRNHQRPLWFMSNTAKTTVFWSSEKEMLEFARKRERLSMEDPVELPPNMLLTVDLLGNQFVGDFEACAPRPPPPVVVPMHHGRGHRRGGKHWPSGVSHDNNPFFQDENWVPEWERELQEWQEECDRKKLAKQSAAAELDDQKFIDASLGKAQAAVKAPHGPDVRQPKAWFRGFEGHKFGIEYALKNLSKGCLCCGSHGMLENETWWFSRTDYVCGDCMTRRSWFIGGYMTDTPFYASSLVGDTAEEIAHILQSKKPPKVNTNNEPC